MYLFKDSTPLILTFCKFQLWNQIRKNSSPSVINKHLYKVNEPIYKKLMLLIFYDILFEIIIRNHTWYMQSHFYDLPTAQEWLPIICTDCHQCTSTKWLITAVWCICMHNLYWWCAFHNACKSNIMTYQFMYIYIN